MVNAIKVAARFIERLPAGSRCRRRRPRGYEGFVHPYVVQAGVDRTSVKLLVRDFVTAGLQREGGAGSSRSRREVVAAVPGASFESRSRSRTATCARCSTSIPPSSSTRARRSARAGLRVARAADPRRHRRLAAVVHGAADAEPLRRRAQLPLAARVGVGAGHGEGGRGDRRAGARVGRTNIASSVVRYPLSVIARTG